MPTTTTDGGRPSRGPDPLDLQTAAEAIRLSSQELFAGRRQIVIVHGRQEYRLQITKGGKLILTK